MDDVIAALYNLRRAFAKAGIPCPDVLEYSKAEDAYKALPHFRHLDRNCQWGISPDARPYGELFLQGFTVRFEARQIERPGLGSELDDGISGRIFLDDLPRDGVE